MVFWTYVLLCFLLQLNVDTTKSEIKGILCLDPSTALKRILRPCGTGAISFTCSFSTNLLLIQIQPKHIFN